MEQRGGKFNRPIGERKPSEFKEKTLDLRRVAMKKEELGLGLPPELTRFHLSAKQKPALKKI